MDTNANCARVLLAQNVSGRLIYCESCEVVELVLGAVSMRIEAEALRALAALLQNAHTQLANFQQARQQARLDPSLAQGQLH